ncbi:MAG TPA: UPF0182 family protein [Actinomycetaceae bacterium]|nr:UPF0182 family protein [Actinomycetaceae bacterium]
MTNSEYEMPPQSPPPARQMTFQRPQIGPFWMTVIILVILTIVVVAFAGIWTEVLWYNQVGYSEVFWTSWLARIGLFLLGALIVGGTVGLNIFLAFRSRRAYRSMSAPDRNLEQYRRQIQPLRHWIFWGTVIVVGGLFGSALSNGWQTVLLVFNQQPFGTVDPEFGLDIAFYVFTLPFLRLVTQVLMTALGLSLVTVAAVAYLYGGLTITPKLRVSRPTRIHLAILAALIMLVGAVNLWLDRYSALVADGERFSGAGFTSVNAGIPASAILAGIAVVVAILFLVSSVRGDWKLPVTGLTLMVVSALVVGVAYPAIVQRFTVDPNAVERESEFISRNISATLEAYGLADHVSISYNAETEAGPGQLRDDAESTAQIRLWDPTIADQTFRQYQQSRQYYDFADTLSVDRYNLDDSMHDTVIAVRELNLNGLSPEQRTWINDHTVYTHGFGVVAAYGNQTAADGRPRFFEQGVPSQGRLPEYEQRIYFGEGVGLPEFSIVGSPEGTAAWEFDYPSDQADSQYVQYTFEGDGGPSLGGINQFLFAISMQDLNILFSDRVTSESQILYNRDPRERVAQVAPFLTLDGRTYPAVIDHDDDPDTPARVLWIVDAYTTSNEYPYSSRESLESATATSLETTILAPVSRVNYMRNSVKAVVDAYDGTVTLFEWESDDPVLNAWKGIFPEIITPTSEISGDLMSHFRYPEDLFKVQRQLMTRYHVDDPSSFYSGNDFWMVPNDPIAGEAVPQPPYYMTVTMPDEDQSAFALTSAFIPGGQSGRQILTGFMSANGDAGNQPGVIGEDYGRIHVLELPRDLTVPGPGQVQNMFNADFTISTELNLLQQGGSAVLRGNLLTLPVGGGLLYVQPVYTQSSTGTQVPLLHRILVSFGEEIGFAPTLQEALDQVFGGDAGAETSDAGAAEPGTEVDPAIASAEERLRDALERAAAAIQESETALASGDWAGYGAAQDRLNDALVDAIEAEAEISGEPAIPDPTAETPEAPAGEDGAVAPNAPADDGAGEADDGGGLFGGLFGGGDDDTGNG